MNILAPLLMLAFYGMTNGYIGKKFYAVVHILVPDVSPMTFGIAYGAFVLLTVVLMICDNLAGSRAKAVLARLGNYWLGIYLYMFMYWLAYDFLDGLSKATGSIPMVTPDRFVLTGGGLVVALVIVTYAYGTWHAAQVRIKRYDIVIENENLPDDMTIALISDIHLGYVIGAKHLKKIKNVINAANVDLVCIAGDVFDGDYTALNNPDAAIDVFRGIHSKYGTFACPGNHDAGKTYPQMVDFLSRAGITLLPEEMTVIDGRMVLAGRIDSSPHGRQDGHRTSIQALLGSVDASLPVIMMDHQPSNIAEYGPETDLILAGHTHKGQIFPLTLITFAVYDVHYGYYRQDSQSPQMIVSSGAGTWGPPFRLASDSEVALIHIKNK